jgi:hypothetical protein
LNFNTFVFVSFVWVVRVGKRLAKSWKTMSQLFWR